MGFDVLFWVTLLCAALALVRLWPGLFVVAINQAGVLRALGNIEQYGQPWSQSFVPSGVFSLENLAIARNVFAICTLALAVAVAWPSRAREGAGAVSSFVQLANDKEANTARTGEGAETFGNSVQYAAHVLECISLYEGGLSREWRSVYLPIVYTFEPSFLAGPLGFTRPREAAWELMDYYVHGGGIYVPGELYWNGGYLCVALVFAALVAFCRRCDVRYGASVGWLVMFAWFLPNLLQGIGYGFAQVSRGVFNGLLALVVWKVGAIVMRGRRGALPPPVQPPPVAQQAR